MYDKIELGLLEAEMQEQKNFGLSLSTLKDKVDKAEKNKKVVLLEDLGFGDIVEVSTQNSGYTFLIMDSNGRAMALGTGKYFTDWTETYIIGATPRGSSMIVMGKILLGFRLELERRLILTRTRKIRVLKAGELGKH